LKTAAGTRKFLLPETKPVFFEAKNNLPVDPYLLGLLLGDGGLTSRGVKISTADQEIVDSIHAILARDYPGEVILGDPHSKYDYRFKKPYNGSSKCLLELALEELELMGKLSTEKFIPEQYLYNSVEVRVALLQGLMDSDGTTGISHSSLSFSSSSVVLSSDFVTLCRSLGIRCNTSSRKTKYSRPDGIKVDGKTSYRTNLLMTDANTFVPFRLKRQLDRYSTNISSHKGRFIESIRLVDRDECQCIAIGSTDKLYITDDYVVTHNTTMAITGAIEAQKAFPDKHVVIIDAEHALDRNYCKKLGLDMSKVFISQPECGEQGLDILEDLISTGRVSFAIVDSVATLIPKSELDGEITDSSMGTQARLMSKACRKLVGIVNKTGTILFFTNQLRSKIGVVYGSPEVTSGGNALKFYASTRLDIRKTAGDKDGDEIKNIKVTIKTVKNKLAPPFRKCELFINFGEGVDKVSEVLSVAIHTDLIVKTGNTYSYRGSKLGVGLGQAKQMLKDNPEICDEIEALVRKSIADLADLDIEASDELVS
jgi:recombination protein RecA